jgi:cobalt-zinc-cadmium efflux system membrane fusion protein
MKQKPVFILFIFSAIMFSCDKKPVETTATETGLIEITKAQFQSEDMEFGEPVYSDFSDLVHFTGNIEPTVNGLAQISLPVQGLIARIYCQPGQLVNKGATLFDISGNEFVDMQRQFAESAALAKRLKMDYERAKELSAENIGAKKDLIQAESAFNVENAKLNALSINLKNIGLDVSKIEGGEFYSSYPVRSPMRGHINHINTTIGQYVGPQQTIAEIVDAGSLQLKISVFEKDIDKIKTGQDVEFKTAGSGETKYAAKLVSVGKAINENTMSIDCYAKIENLENAGLVSGQFVEGEIIADSDSAISLPQAAIIDAEDGTFVLTFEKETGESISLKKTVVKTGRKNADFIELTEVPTSKRILVKGVYNIQVE